MRSETRRWTDGGSGTRRRTDNGVFEATYGVRTVDAGNLSLYGPLREAVDKNTLERDMSAGATVGDAFDDLAADHPDLRELLFDGEECSRSVVVVRNGRNVAFEDGIKTPVDDGDVRRASPPGGKTIALVEYT